MRDWKIVEGCREEEGNEKELEVKDRVILQARRVLSAIPHRKN